MTVQDSSSVFTNAALDDYTAANVVNGSGLTLQSADIWHHDVDTAGLTYLSDGTTTLGFAWFEFDLGVETTLSEIHLWNGNSDESKKIDRGAEFIDVYVSDTGVTGTWGMSIDTITAAMGSGETDYAGERFDVTDTVGRYVRFEIATHGDAFAAISEVHFYSIPEPGTYALLAGLTGLTFVMLRRSR